MKHLIFDTEEAAQAVIDHINTQLGLPTAMVSTYALPRLRPDGRAVVTVDNTVYEILDPAVQSLAGPLPEGIGPVRRAPSPPQEE